MLSLTWYKTGIMGVRFKIDCLQDSVVGLYSACDISIRIYDLVSFGFVWWHINNC